MKEVNDRRNFLKAAGASVVGASLVSTARSQKDESDNSQRPIYLNGCGWNRDLPGNLGLACFSFDVRANLGGTGFGTIRDDVYMDANSQFEITSVTRHGKIFTFLGNIISSRNPDLVGKRVRIVAESTGEATGKASLTVESDEDNLVVIAIIAILIGLLIPAVQ